MESFGQKEHHFLIVTIAAQGQINPARHLAARLAQPTGLRATIATPVSSHRLMFPSSDPADIIIDSDDNVSYASYSDGFDQGFHPETNDLTHFLAELPVAGSRTLAALARSLTDRGRPVTCVVYTLLSEWAAGVAADVLGVPSVPFWIQPAAVFSIFYHYFNRGFDKVINAHLNDELFRLNLPGLPPLELKDLPAMLTTDSADPLLAMYRNMMKILREDSRKPAVLMNTFRALEADVIETLNDHHHLNIICVGPVVDIAETPAAAGSDLFERDKSDYVNWLDAKEEGSVVYVSFGSLSSVSTAQMEEFSKGLRESGRPYLWVVRRDVREKEGLLVERLIEDAAAAGGMVIGWCDQVRVLAHRAAGCFVTHCGWNSVLESLACGVPMVAVPQRMDQHTNAKMAEAAWGTAVRARVDAGEGVVTATEMRKCLDLAMGMRKKAEVWKKKAAEAVAERGAAVRDIVAHLDQM